MSTFNKQVADALRSPECQEVIRQIIADTLKRPIFDGNEIADSVRQALIAFSNPASESVRQTFL